MKLMRFFLTPFLCAALVLSGVPRAQAMPEPIPPWPGPSIIALPPALDAAVTVAGTWATYTTIAAAGISLGALAVIASLAKDLSWYQISYKHYEDDEFAQFPGDTYFPNKWNAISHVWDAGQGYMTQWEWSNGVGNDYHTTFSMGWFSFDGSREDDYGREGFYYDPTAPFRSNSSWTTYELRVIASPGSPRWAQPVAVDFAGYRVDRCINCNWNQFYPQSQYVEGRVGWFWPTVFFPTRDVTPTEAMAPKDFWFSGVFVNGW